MPSKKSVYLAGPITGLPYGEARRGWREEIAGLMATQSPHIECFSPMRAKEFLSEHQSLECRGHDLEKIGHALSRPLGILTRDFNDVTQRDAMVACFLGAKRVSIGTVWEIGVAYSHRKPVVVVMEPAQTIVTETREVTERFSIEEFNSGELRRARLTKLGYDPDSVEVIWSHSDLSAHGLIAGLRIPSKTEVITNPHDHVFVTHTSGYVVETLEEAALILGSILTPGT